VAFDLREVDLKRKPAELLALSPAARVPMLDLGGDEVLTRNLAIVRWALDPHDPNSWLTRGDAARGAHQTALAEGNFKHWLDRIKYPERFSKQHADSARTTAGRCLIEPLEAALTHMSCLGGNAPTWASASVFPFVHQFAAIDAARWAISFWWRPPSAGARIGSAARCLQPAWSKRRFGSRAAPGHASRPDAKTACAQSGAAARPCAWLGLDSTAPGPCLLAGAGSANDMHLPSQRWPHQHWPSALMMQVPVPQQRGSSMFSIFQGFGSEIATHKGKHPEVALGRMRLCAQPIAAFASAAMETRPQ